MVETKQEKQGFTLVEILIALVILMMFFVAAAKILTAKPKRHYPNSVHGLYECYKEGSTTKSHEVHEAYNKKVTTETGGVCTFKPYTNVAFYSVIIVFPKSNTNADKAYIDTQPSINNKLYLYPKSSAISDGGTLTESYAEESPMLDRNELQPYLETTYKYSKVKDIVSSGSTLDGAIILAW